MDASASLEKTTHATRDDVEEVASAFRAPRPGVRQEEAPFFRRGESGSAGASHRMGAD